MSRFAFCAGYTSLIGRPGLPLLGTSKQRRARSHMERMLELLLSLGEVKNYSLYGYSDQLCPPIILVWYRQVRAGAVDKLTRAFASYLGTLEWSLQAIPGG